MDNKIAEAVEVLNHATTAMWMEMPAEVDGLHRRRGTKGYRWPVIMCAEENTRAFADDVSVLRKAGDDPSLDLRTLKQLARLFIEAQLGILRNWYGMEDTVQLIEGTLDALDATETREDYVAYTHELGVYVGRLHWWVDTLIPWDDMSAMYEKRDQ
jgi:hypothetical protein